MDEHEKEYAKLRWLSEKGKSKKPEIELVASGERLNAQEQHYTLYYIAGKERERHRVLVSRDYQGDLCSLASKGTERAYEEAIALLDEMQIVALFYACENEWSNETGLYFLSYVDAPLNLHLIDLALIKPANDYLPLSSVKTVLRDELTILRK